MSGKAGEVARALADGADYIGVGAVYSTSTKPDKQAIGPEGVRAVRQDAGTLPIVAIGGIDETRVAPSIEAGADGVAVVSALFAAEDVVKATRAVQSAVRAALDEHRLGREP